MPAVAAFNWALLAPIMVVFGGAVISVLVEAFVPRVARWLIQSVWSFTVLIIALMAVFLSWNPPQTFTAQNELFVEPIAWNCQAIVLIIAILSVLVMMDRTSAGDSAFAAQPSDRPGSAEEQLSLRTGVQRSEIFPLVLFSSGGMMVFPMCSSLLTMFVALEVFSLPLYILCATARRRRLLSQESAIKYFALGAFASTFFLMGTALVFGMVGTVNLIDISQQLNQAKIISLATPKLLLLLVGFAFIVISLLFKAGAAPFHAWTPDVYQGAPTPITGFMAAAVKVAAFFALIRIWVIGGKYVGADITWFMIAVIVLTIVIGTFIGLIQTNLKRLLAYSSIAHAGFILIALLVIFMVQGVAQLAATGIFFYLVAYAIATVGTFAVFTLVRETDENGTVLGEANELSQFDGLGKKNPVLAAALTIFLLSFAGIPLTSGFVAKFYVFSAGVVAGAVPLVLVAVAASAITAYYYFKIVVAMFFNDPAEMTVTVRSTGSTAVVIAVCAVFTIVAGVMPGVVLNFL